MTNDNFHFNRMRFGVLKQMGPLTTQKMESAKEQRRELLPMPSHVWGSKRNKILTH